MSKISFLVVLLSSVSITCFSANTKTVSEVSQINMQGISYLINSHLDLKGEHFQLPANCTLIFDGGELSNGTLIGDNTSISAGKKQIFSKIIIKGEWLNRIVYSQWLPFNPSPAYDNVSNFKNLMSLCKGECTTRVYMEEGDFSTSLIEGSSPINIPSNTHFVNYSTIRTISNNCVYADLVLINKRNNVVIEGGTYIGDCKSHKVAGEWLHGITCRGSSNVTIKNVTCCYFWGDGIDIIEGYDVNGAPTIIPSNITIVNSKCVYNRRQGISVEAVNRCEIRNCETAFTGVAGYTPPAAGIDIEAWDKSCPKINNVVIRGCNSHDNLGAGIQIMANSAFGKYWREYDNEIVIQKCSIGRLIVFRSCNIQINKSSVESIDALECLDLSVNNRRISFE